MISGASSVEKWLTVCSSLRMLLDIWKASMVLGLGDGMSNVAHYYILFLLNFI